MYPQNTAALISAAQLLFHHGVWIDFGRVPSASGLDSGKISVESMASVETRHLKENGTLPQVR